MGLRLLILMVLRLLILMGLRLLIESEEVCKYILVGALDDVMAGLPALAAQGPCESGKIWYRRCFVWVGLGVPGKSSAFLYTRSQKVGI